VVIRAWRSSLLRSLRRKAAALFATGDYVPLVAKGILADKVVAFARIGANANASVVVIAPRFCLKLLKGQAVPLVLAQQWEDTCVVLPQELAGLRWRNICTGEDITGEDALLPGAALRHFPVAMLASAN